MISPSANNATHSNDVEDHLSLLNLNDMSPTGLATLNPTVASLPMNPSLTENLHSNSNMNSRSKLTRSALL